jgi:CHAD domain-containing protein
MRALGDPPDDASLHNARRKAKHARHATETLAHVDARWPEPAATHAEDLQSVLGDYQDRVVARSWLEHVARDRPELAFVSGELAGRLAAEQDDLRDGARAVWKVVAKQRVERGS